MNGVLLVVFKGLPVASSKGCVNSFFALLFFTPVEEAGWHFVGMEVCV